MRKLTTLLKGCAAGALLLTAGATAWAVPASVTGEYSFKADVVFNPTYDGIQEYIPSEFDFTIENTYMDGFVGYNSYLYYTYSNGVITITSNRLQTTGFYLPDTYMGVELGLTDSTGTWPGLKNSGGDIMKWSVADNGTITIPEFKIVDRNNGNPVIATFTNCKVTKTSGDGGGDSGNPGGGPTGTYVPENPTLGDYTVVGTYDLTVCPTDFSLSKKNQGTSRVEVLLEGETYYIREIGETSYFNGNIVPFTYQDGAKTATFEAFYGGKDGNVPVIVSTFISPLEINGSYLYTFTPENGFEFPGTTGLGWFNSTDASGLNPTGEFVSMLFLLGCTPVETAGDGGETTIPEGAYVVYSNGVLNPELKVYGWWNDVENFQAANPAGNGQVFEFKAGNLQYDWGNAGYNGGSMGINMEAPQNTGMLHDATLSFDWYSNTPGAKYTMRLTAENEYNYNFEVTDATANKWNTTVIDIPEEFPELAEEWNKNQNLGEGYVFSIVLDGAAEGVTLDDKTAIYFNNIFYTNVDETWTAPKLDVPVPETVPVPKQAAADVLSVYSSAYTSPTWFNIGGWGQSTKVTEVEIDNNKVEWLRNFNYLGWELQQDIDVSGYEYMHVDYWTSTENAGFGFTPITREGTVKEKNIPVEVVAVDNWTSVDVALKDWSDAGMDLSTVFQIKFDGGNGEQDGYIANVYFWKEAQQGDVEPVDAKALEGSWEIPLDGHYQGAYSLNTFTGKYEARAQGNVITFSSVDSDHSIIGELQADNTVVFKKAVVVPAIYSLYQLPYVNTNGTNEIEDLDFVESLTATYNPTAKTLTFPAGKVCGLAYARLDDKGNLSFYDDAFDFAGVGMQTGGLVPTLSITGYKVNIGESNLDFEVDVTLDNYDIQKVTGWKAVVTELFSSNETETDWEETQTIDATYEDGVVSFSITGLSQGNHDFQYVIKAFAGEEEVATSGIKAYSGVVGPDIMIRNPKGEPGDGEVEVSFNASFSGFNTSAATYKVIYTDVKTITDANPEGNPQEAAATVGEDNVVTAVIGDGLLPVGTYEFNIVLAAYVDGEMIAKSNKLILAQIIISESTGVDMIGTDSANARYYNLQGVEVKNPESGKIYIRVENGKAVKEVR